MENVIFNLLSLTFFLHNSPHHEHNYVEFSKLELFVRRKKCRRLENEENSIIHVSIKKKNCCQTRLRNNKIINL